MSEARAEWVTAAPAGRLAPYVDRYIGYRLAGFPAGVHRGLPSRHMTFIVDLGGGIDVAAQTDPRQAPATYRTVLGGLQATPALIAHDGNQGYFDQAHLNRDFARLAGCTPTELLSEDLPSIQDGEGEDRRGSPS